MWALFCERSKQSVEERSENARCALPKYTVHIPETLFEGLMFGVEKIEMSLSCTMLG